MKDYGYLSPAKLEEATGLLEKYGKKAVVLAGGTDLLVNLKNNRGWGGEHRRSCHDEPDKSLRNPQKEISITLSNGDRGLSQLADQKPRNDRRKHL
jgi:hypothetical protein